MSLAAGDGVPVLQCEAHNFAKAQGHNGEVVATQPQHGKAQAKAEKHGEETADGQAGPEAEAEILVQQAVCIRANGVKSHVAKHKLARQTHNDVQAQRQHDVQQGGDHDVGLVEGADQRHADEHNGKHGKPAKAEASAVSE